MSINHGKHFNRIGEIGSPSNNIDADMMKKENEMPREMRPCEREGRSRVGDVIYAFGDFSLFEGNSDPEFTIHFGIIVDCDMLVCASVGGLAGVSLGVFSQKRPYAIQLWGFVPCTPP